MKLSERLLRRLRADLGIARGLSGVRCVRVYGAGAWAWEVVYFESRLQIGSYWTMRAIVEAPPGSLRTRATDWGDISIEIEANR